ncbi:MAG: hypothetical protein ACHQZR_01645 [Candidatus Limnocylindrales bacterium]
MSLLQQLLVAIAAMIVLIALRLVRARAGRTPFPQGRGRLLLIIAFLIVPPVAAGWLTDPAVRATPLLAIASLPVYIALFALLTILMAVVVRLDQAVRPGRSHRLLRIALLGRDDDPAYTNFDPPLKGELARAVALVERSNAAFPRGSSFPDEVDQPGFRTAWDALDADATALEMRLASERRLGHPVPSEAVAMAADARGRLETLRQFASDHGQAWAAQ